jgi:dihydrofolate synthase/folylpolyglutamate synthase
VSSAIQPEVQRLFHDIAADSGSPCYLGGRQFDYVRTALDRFDYLGLQTRWPEMPLPLPGRHQFQNAAAACAALELLAQAGFRISPDQVREGFRRVRWPGRLEHVSRQPDLWLDGAHNPDAAFVLADFLKGLPSDRKIHLILAFKADKQQKEFVEILAPLVHRITVTTVRGLLPADEAGRIASGIHPNVVVEHDFSRIMAQLFWRQSPDEIAVVTGSLYLVGAAKRWLSDNHSVQ